MSFENDQMFPILAHFHDAIALLKFSI